MASALPGRPAPAADADPMREPVFELLGVRLTGWEPGHAEFELSVETRHLNFGGGLHGGVASLLLDVACGYAALETLPGGIATISLAVNFLAPVPLGLVRATGHATGGGRRIVFASATLTDAAGRTLATAQGSFKRSGG